jgi:hypothetical protein
MKMPSQTWLYLGKRVGMMMKSRSIGLYGILKILVWFYRNNSKKEFEEHQNHAGDEEFHQESDHPSTFMKMVKEITRTISDVNDERRQVLPSKVILDGTIDHLEVFRNNVESHYGQTGAGYYLIHASRRLI